MGMQYASGFGSGLDIRAPYKRQLRDYNKICLLLAVFLSIIAVLVRPDVRAQIAPSAFKMEHELGADIYMYDLNAAEGTPAGAKRNERILLLVPLRDAEAHLDMFFGHLEKMTYPHELIDLAFLVSDTTDNTVSVLVDRLNSIQRLKNTGSKKAHLSFGNVNIYKRDFGQVIGQGFSDRHSFEAQGPRRKLMASARNWLLSTALEPYHSWVYWRDADVETVPSTILEDLMKHNKDVTVPNVWRPLPDWLGYEQPYDLNSWQESATSLQLAESLDEDAVVVEGYEAYATWRPHLAYLRDPNGDPSVEIALDGIGGVSIMAKARVFRQGALFPAFSYKRHAETEGFGKLCNDMGFSVIGLPHYTIWHIYEPSEDDIKHMERVAQEEARIQQEEALREEVSKIFESGFEDVHDAWDDEKQRIMGL